MKLSSLLKRITRPPWRLVTAADGDQWIGTEAGDDRIATLDGSTESLHNTYLVHAANVLPQLLAAAKNLQDNWEHNLTKPMWRLNEAIQWAENVDEAGLPKMSATSSKSTRLRSLKRDKRHPRGRAR